MWVKMKKENTYQESHRKKADKKLGDGNNYQIFFQKRLKTHLPRLCVWYEICHENTQKERKDEPHLTHFYRCHIL